MAAGMVEETETTIRATLPPDDAQRWMDILRHDAPHVAAAAGRTPSAAYLAGSVMGRAPEAQLFGAAPSASAAPAAAQGRPSPQQPASAGAATGSAEAGPQRAVSGGPPIDDLD